MISEEKNIKHINQDMIGKKNKSWVNSLLILLICLVCSCNNNQKYYLVDFGFGGNTWSISGVSDNGKYIYTRKECVDKIDKSLFQNYDSLREMYLSVDPDSKYPIKKARNVMQESSGATQWQCVPVKIGDEFLREIIPADKYSDAHPRFAPYKFMELYPDDGFLYKSKTGEKYPIFPFDE